MLKVEATPSLIQWATQVVWKVGEDLREDEPGLVFNAELTSPPQFAAGFDPDSTDPTVRLWVKLQYDGYYGWYAEGGCDQDRKATAWPVSVHFAEALDGEREAVKRRLHELATSDPCPYTQSHTRAFCGRPSCRES